MVFTAKYTVTEIILIRLTIIYRWDNIILYDFIFYNFLFLSKYSEKYERIFTPHHLTESLKCIVYWKKHLKRPWAHLISFCPLHGHHVIWNEAREEGKTEKGHKNKSQWRFYWSASPTNLKLILFLNGTENGSSLVSSFRAGTTARREIIMISFAYRLRWKKWTEEWGDGMNKEWARQQIEFLLWMWKCVMSNQLTPRAFHIYLVAGIAELYCDWLYMHLFF